MVEQTLLALKALFLLLLYVFVWRVIRAAARDLRVPQESVLLGPAQAAALGFRPAAPPSPPPRLVVTSSSVLDPGAAFDLGPVPLTLGRAEENEVVLPEEGFASAHHARVEARGDAAWVVDLESTNGTFVNDERIEGRRRLSDGDVVRIGHTELRFEE